MTALLYCWWPGTKTFRRFGSLFIKVFIPTNTC